MAWISRWQLDRKKPLDSRFLRMGRYSDAYKSAAQRTAWEQAVRWFSKRAYLRSMQYVLHYLHDPMEQNLHWMSDRHGNISFELLQGSRKISGACTTMKVEGITTLGMMSSYSEELLRTLLEINYGLQYCCYALEESGRIVMHFSLPVEEAIPDRVIAALRELALESDRMDDLLVDRFPDMQPVREPHVRAKPVEEVMLRVSWFRHKVSHLIAWYHQEQRLHEKYPVGFSFALLDTLFKMEFLLTPQGPLREIIDELLSQYLHNRSIVLRDQHQWALRKLEVLMAQSDEELGREFYDVTATFSQVAQIAPGQWNLLLKPALDQWEIYQHGATRAYLRYIPGYIMAYCLYKYEFPGFWRDLVALYYLLTEPEWAQGLRCPRIGFYSGGRPDKRAINKTLRSLEAEWQDRFIITDFNPAGLNYKDEDQFGESWLQMMANLKIELR
jgi:hypothetical protein